MEFSIVKVNGPNDSFEYEVNLNGVITLSRNIKNIKQAMEIKNSHIKGFIENLEKQIEVDF